MLPPVRLDYSPMKVVKNDKNLKDDTNFLINSGRNKKVFVVNQYKNVSSHGQQIIKIPPKLNTIINMWLRYNDTGNFLLNNRREMLSANGLGKALSRIMKPSGKNITINLLRSIYISENMNMEAIKASEKMANDMMHSTSVQKNIYYKED